MSEPFDPMRLDGRHYLVTGASSGIGRATAVYLHRLGARLSLVDRDAAGLASLCTGLGDAADAHEADLSDLTGISGLVMRCVERAGPLHGLVHCAGIQSVQPLRTLQVDGWRDIFAVNAEAALMLTKAVTTRKSHAGTHGSIIFISSVMGSVGSAGAIAYSMSKAALDGMARSLAVELAPRRIRVNCIAPGYVRTPLFERTERLWDEATRRAVEDLHPLGFGAPDDVAAAVAFLLADTGRWITGTVLVADGGYLAR